MKGFYLFLAIAGIAVFYEKFPKAGGAMLIVIVLSMVFIAKQKGVI